MLGNVWLKQFISAHWPGLFCGLCPELLFQLWQCGGMMVDAPCSRIGHIYRKFAPFPNPGVGDFVGRVRLKANKITWLRTLHSLKKKENFERIKLHKVYIKHIFSFLTYVYGTCHFSPREIFKQSKSVFKTNINDIFIKVLYWSESFKWDKCF